MPRLASILLALLLWVPALAQWDDTDQPENFSSSLQEEEIFDGLSVSLQVEDIEKTVADAAHYVGLVADAVKELDYADRLSGYAISKRVSAQIREKLAIAIELMSTIIVDPQLTEDQKAKFTFELASSIGEVVLTIVRHHGEDQVDIPRNPGDVTRLTNWLREVLLDLKAVWPQRSALFSRVPEGAGWWQRFRYQASESPLGIVARINRDREARAAFEKLEAFGREALPDLGEDSALRKAHRDFWTKEIVNRTLRIREARANDKKVVTGLYFGLAAYSLFAPPVDILGLLDGRSDNSLFMSSMIYFSFWVMVGSSKMRSVSDRTVQLAKNLAKILNTPVADIVGPGRGSFIQRLRSLGSSKSTIRTCSEFLQEEED